jgi:membrane-associated PAP2 superfamily phosphatase
METAVPVGLSRGPRRDGTRLPWAVHALPVLVLGASALLLQWSGADRAPADALYDPAGRQWLLDVRQPLSRLLYLGERAAVITLVVAGLGALLASLQSPVGRHWRRPLCYLLACFAVTTGLVSLGKHATNVDCPRALAGYGGTRPYVGLFEDRPAGLPRAECFPAGHASAGYAFISLYFIGATRRRRWAGLALGAGAGLALGATQWARGMHFPSHDLASAAIAWAVALVAAGAFGLWPGPARR